ncbi:MAG: MFS transporter [Phycisphaerae bacterium]|jgi:hypothetical protein
MSSVPTNAERIRRLPWWFAAGMLDNVRISLIFGPVLILFLDALKLDKAKIGVLLSLPLFFQILSVFVVPLVEKIGYKRSCLIFYSIRTGILSGLLLTPLIVRYFGPGGAFLWVGFIMLIFSISLAISLTAAGPWGQEILPTNIRSKVIALNTFLCGLVVISGTWFAGFWLERSSGLGGFMFLITIGIIFGFSSITSHLFFPGGGRIKKESPGREHIENMLIAFKDKDFVRLLAGIGVFIFIVQGVASFVPLFMKDIVGINSGRVVFLTMWTTAGTLIAVYFWGWAADRFGGKPVFLTGIMFHIILPVLWYLVPRHHGNISYFAASAVSFAAGLMCVAYLIGIDRYLFLTAIPADKKASYHAVWFGLTGLCASMGPMAVGVALKWFSGLDNVGVIFGHIRVDSYIPVFAIHMILPAIGIYIIRNIKADSELTTTQFVGQLFESVPFGLFGSLSSIMRYRMSGEESERIATTRGLGRLDSPFNTDELIEALNDPSFDVRYEAIVAMAARKPHRKTVLALIDVLGGADIELSATAAWALGQIGDAEAIPALRKQLSAPYRILRARSARALGRLDDVESAPELLNLFAIETDPALKTAYASTLSILKYVPAMEQIFDLLADVESEVLRRELALAAARIIGSERTYIKLFRSAQSDWSTTVSSAILKLKKPIAKLKLDPSLAEIIAVCADSFAAEKSGWGVELLWPILDAMPKDQIDQEFRKVFTECSKRLEQFGSQRWEYTLLAIHTCDVWLRARIALQKHLLP